MAFYKKTRHFIAFIVTLFLVTLLFYYSYQVFMTSAYPLKYEKDIVRSSQKYKIDKYLLLAIIREESRFKKNSVSKKGAIGLMQLMPKTATWISSERSLPYKKEKLYNPDINIDYGTWYFNYLIRKYKSKDIALAAYNSGTKIMDEWLAKHPDKNLNNFVYSETRVFVGKVNKTYKVYKKLYPASTFK
ncbi:MAG: lytic transglycosylase domain-containing protein [Actinobacteria bacterium]|nr:MAG: lytic transglycosylase domain-containing protein [Actinomycetota bacterium]